MASLDLPKTWIPYMNSTDCAQGFCSLYCPQWCYIIFPPPPPLEFPDDSSNSNFSPLVIAIIGILASAFLLVSYYALISKYCRNHESARRRHNNGGIEELEDNHDNPSLHEPWYTATTGLDEALIKSITVYKFKKGDGLIEGTDCSVCLSEFAEDESLRLLPKCSHAFHVPCIDTWLRSHSNCPLCRANIIFISASQPLLPSPATESPEANESLQETQQTNDQNTALTQEDTERSSAAGGEEASVHNTGDVQKSNSSQMRVFSGMEAKDTIIEIREDGHEHFRRSVSMDHSCQSCVSVADILRMNQEDEVTSSVEDGFEDVGTSSSKHVMHKSSYKRRVLQSVLGPVTLKRSWSSGRFFLSGQGRVSDSVSPV
ncbi:hypothetical protein K2173_009533 [Erythroxylum novogranatense]|uniref:RING-type E3 ubiquitin transferase n=1 Tax=Erythroxylum novogranatense TaxID=1862640 RepID=A0AAV8U475_9ROSI|nr:hypothetical protein K2173_009533 [Erythroxylum novogranatense]